MQGDFDENITIYDSEVEIHNILTLVGITIVYYDYLITVKREYLYIWRTWRTLRSNRHLSVFAHTVLCTNFYIIATYGSPAMPSTSKAWAMIRQPGDTLVWKQGCYFTSSTTSAMHTAAQWETALAYDAVILLLTLFKTYDWRAHLKYGSARPPDTISLVYKYGAIYFGAIVLAHGTNVATFYALPQPSLRGSLSTAASAISVSMMSRLTLDLHSRALRRHNNMTSLLPSSVTASSTTRNFELTSQISVAESDEDAFDNDLEWDEDE
ncbi:hypothetical protein BC629DRAFT_1592320 [Irpex lacteus]|nr:hypothetical protein BC629DRAFT_1592320 [Irpex lacteus]